MPLRLERSAWGFESFLPWSLTFIDFNKVVLTEKSGDLLSVELENKTIKKIKHNLNMYFLPILTSSDLDVAKAQSKDL